MTPDHASMPFQKELTGAVAAAHPAPAGQPAIEMLSPPIGVSMADDWYQYANTGHFWFQWRFEVLRRLLRGIDLGDRILEIGCGNGISRDQFEAELDRPVHGCDLNLAAIRLAAPGRGRLYYYNIHDRRPEWRGAFDSILLLDTLEHIDDTRGFLDSVQSHLRPGGYLVINVPAIQSLYSRYDEVAGHIKRYSVPVLKDELGGAGLELVRWRYWGWTMMPVLAARAVMLSLSSREQVIRRGFDPGSPTADRILRGLMRVELASMSAPRVGASLSALARRTV